MIRAGRILYALVALVPVLFYRGTSEVFEFPKTELLASWTRSRPLGPGPRGRGTLGHANHLGTFTAMMLPLVAWLATTATSRGARVTAMVLGIISIPVLAATLSRGAWVAAAAGLLAFGILSWRRRRSSLLREVVVIAAVLVALLRPLRPV